VDCGDFDSSSLSLVSSRRGKWGGDSPASGDDRKPLRLNLSTRIGSQMISPDKFCQREWLRTHLTCARHICGQGQGTACCEEVKYTHYDSHHEPKSSQSSAKQADTSGAGAIQSRLGLTRTSGGGHTHRGYPGRDQGRST
jgi:hypothetical protein